MKRIVLSLFMLLCASSALWADPVTFEATVNAPRISLDEVLQLTLTITGVNADLNPISLPVLDGFSAKYLGPSTSVSIINGDYHSEKSFIYSLFPNRVGRFQIPPISATIEGQTYTTKPIDVEVFQNTSQAQQAQTEGEGADQTTPPNADNLKDKILIAVSLSKTRCYLNERIPLDIKLLVANGIPVRDIQYPQFDRTGFTVDDFEKPEQGSQVIDGVKYDTVEFKTNIYPNHLGLMTLGPMQIEGNILYKTGQSNPFNEDNDFFAGNFFNGFFDTYATRPATVTSKPIQLHVSPLPEAGRPPEFSGAIGQFDFQASVSPSLVKAGDPLTLKMDLQGSGNFKNIKIPSFQAPEFKSYEPQIKGSADEKTAEEVIIPTSAAIKEVPALHFSYFDPSLGEYKTVTQGPFPVTVTSPSPEQEFKAMGFADVSKEPSVLPGSQFSWMKIFHDLYKILKKLCGIVWFWLGLGIVFAAGIFYTIWRRFQERLENDPAFARKLKAVREARQALAPAEQYIAADKQKDFYALLSKVLREYLANKWHYSSAALNVQEITSRLKGAKLDDAHIHQVKMLLEQADMVCFAGAVRDAAGMRADLAQAQELISHLQKQLK